MAYPWSRSVFYTTKKVTRTANGPHVILTLLREKLKLSANSLVADICYMKRKYIKYRRIKNTGSYYLSFIYSPIDALVSCL